MRRIRLPRMRVRSRNRFVIVVIIIAIVLVLAAVLAYMVLVDKPERQPVPPKRPPPPPPVQPFPERGPEKWAQVDKPRDPPERKTGGRKRTRKTRPETLGDASISGTIRRLAAQFNECARKYGGVDGSVVRVGFSVSPEGGVQSSRAMSPHRSTPLGRCIANTLGGAQFGRSEFGRSDVRWSITLHP